MKSVFKFHTYRHFCRTLFYLSLLCLRYSICHSQSLDVIANSMTRTRNGNLSEIDGNMILSENGLEILNVLQMYSKDSVSNVRLLSYMTQHKLSKVASNKKLNGMIKSSLIAGLRDSNPFIRKYLISKLLFYKASDFSEADKDQLFKNSNDLYLEENFLLLLGSAGVSNAIPFLKRLVTQNSLEDSLSNVGKWYGKTSWNCHLAMARLGIIPEIRYCIGRVLAEDDNVALIMHLFKDLAYIKSYDSVIALQKFLESDETIPSHELNVVESRVCDFSLNQLVEMLEGFPIRSRKIQYTVEEVLTARRWMKSQRKLVLIK